MEKKVIDLKVKISSGDKSVELNTEEAREVYEQLSAFFGKEYAYPYPEIVPYNPSTPWVTYDTSANKK